MKRIYFLSKEKLMEYLDENFLDAVFYPVEILENMLVILTNGSFLEIKEEIESFSLQYLSKMNVSSEDQKFPAITVTFNATLMKLTREKSELNVEKKKSVNSNVIKNLEMKTLTFLSLAEHIVYKNVSKDYEKKLLQDLNIALTLEKDMICGEDLKRLVIAIISNMKLLEELSSGASNLDVVKNYDSTVPNLASYSVALMEGLGAFPLSNNQKKNAENLVAPSETQSSEYCGTTMHLELLAMTRNRKQ